MKRLLFFLFSLLISFCAVSQEDETQSMDDLLDMSLEDLMNMQVSVSTKSSVNIRETPGIVSVITQKEIQNSGARDIIDLVQRYVPGFEFGSDVEGVLGLAVRGVWSYEGKVLLLINGMEANETMFGNAIFGNHYPLESIERIEIVRGPGSVIYGGYASMGVINIITKQAEENGGYVSYMGSHTGKSFTHNNIAFNSQVVKNDLKLSFWGDFATGSRSDKDIKGVYGDSRTMSGNSNIKTRNTGMQINYKNLKISTAIIDYSYKNIDLWDTIYQGIPLTERFSDFISQASYEININENIKLTPQVSYKKQKPWNLNAVDLGYANNKRAEKIVAGLMGNYNKGIVDVLAGFDYSHEDLKLPKFVSPDERVFKDGSDQLEYNAFDVYAQLGLNTKIANITTGVRFDKSELFGHSFAPRIGITKVFDKFHLKAAVNKAFRTPGGILPDRKEEGIKKLEPEEAFTYEVEAGVKILERMYLTCNLFNTDFKKVIVYNLNSSGIGTYKNGGNLGTYGIETTLKHNSEKLSAELNFAYYQRKDNDTDSSVMVTADSKYFLSFSPIKVNAVVSYQVIPNLRITPTVSFFGNKYAYTSIKDGELALEKIKPQTLINLNITYSNLLIEGFNISVGVNNILNEDFKFHTGVKSEHSSIPGLDRSYQLKLSYRY